MILDDLQSRGLHIALQNGGCDLLVSPTSKITPAIRKLIKTRKPELLKELKRKPETIRIEFQPETIRPAERAIVTFVVGKEMERIARFTLPRMQDYADKCNAELIIVGDDQLKKWPIGNKLRFGEIATNFEHTLLLDCDIWINSHAHDIFCHGDGVWMHPDVYFVNQYGFDYLSNELSAIAEAHELEVVHRSTDFPHPQLTWYIPPAVAPLCFNTGVILIDQQAAKSWHLPNHPLAISHTAEQSFIDLMLSNQLFINRLESKWNWLAFGRTFTEGMHDAYFVHLANKSHADRLRLLRRNLSSPSKELTNAIRNT